MAAVEIVSTRQQTDDDWMRDAACKGLTHLFFPSPAERPQARERREATARQVCAQLRRARRHAATSPGHSTSTGSGAARARTNATPPGSA